MISGYHIFSEHQILSLADVSRPEDIGIDLSVQQNARSSQTPFRGLTVPTFESGFVPLDQILDTAKKKENVALFRKNLKPVDYVTSELTGADESPVYGILKLTPKIGYPIQTAEVPWNTTKPVIKWDGEWFITYEVFRDLGGAFAVVLEGMPASLARSSANRRIDTGSGRLR